MDASHLHLSIHGCLTSACSLPLTMSCNGQTKDTQCQGSASPTCVFGRWSLTPSATAWSPSSAASSTMKPL
eukprot:scaffold161958_cov14-Tisochrysis_lutea.AAC.1